MPDTQTKTTPERLNLLAGILSTPARVRAYLPNPDALEINRSPGFINYRNPDGSTFAEIVNQRSLHYKTFIDDRGQTIRVFGKFVHFEESPGKWEDVDLEFRRENAQAHIMDRHFLNARVTSGGVSVWDRATGKGIRWITPVRPAVASQRAQFDDQGLTWVYHTRKIGLKLTATVGASRGPQTYTFRYALLGGAGGFSVDAGGNLVADEFTVPRAFAVGADGKRYAAGAWQILPSQRVAFDFDDTGIPLPYELDPTTNFYANSSDGYVVNEDATYATCRSATTGLAADSFSTKFLVGQTFVSSVYDLWRTFLDFDTSSIGAAESISAATLYVYGATDFSTTDFDITVVQGSQAIPITTADYDAIGSTGGGSVSTSGLSTAAYTGITLDATGRGWISKTGTTKLALRSGRDISATAPSGNEYFEIHSSEATGTANDPYLAVTYTSPPAAPTWTDPAASDTLVGTETLAATTTDADGDNWYATFEVHSNSGYTALVRTITGSTVASGGSSTNTWDTTLDANGTYYLRAKATDTGASVSGWTNLGSVTVANVTAGYHMMI